MTSLELAMIQGAVLILVAPVCATLGATIVSLVRQKTWVMPWVAYRRENTVPAAVAFGAGVTFAVLLPLMSFAGLSGTNGNVFVLIAVLAVVGGASALLNAKSIIPMALCAFGAMLLALSIATSTVNSADILLALSGDTRPAIILVAIALVLTLIALRLDNVSERVRDVRTLLMATLGVFTVNCIAMIVGANLLTSDIPAVNVTILAGKAVGAALIIELLALGVQRHARVTPQRLLRVATFLAILSIMVTLWQLNPSL